MEKLKKLLNKNYFYSFKIVLVIYLLIAAYLAILAFLNPSQIRYPDNHYQIFFEPFFPFNFAIDMHSLILFYIPELVLFYVPIFTLAFIAQSRKVKILALSVGLLGILYTATPTLREILIKMIPYINFDNVTVVLYLFSVTVQASIFVLFLRDSQFKDTREARKFLANMVVLTLTIVLMQIGLITPLNIFINNTLFSNNAKVIRLLNYDYRIKSNGEMEVVLEIESDLTETLALSGGIDYYFGNTYKLRASDYHINGSRGITPGRKTYTSNVQLDNNQMEFIKNTGKVDVTIGLVGQDMTVVEYQSYIDTPLPIELPTD